MVRVSLLPFQSVVQSLVKSDQFGAVYGKSGLGFKRLHFPPKGLHYWNRRTADDKRPAVAGLPISEPATEQLHLHLPLNSQPQTTTSNFQEKTSLCYHLWSSHRTENSNTPLQSSFNVSNFVNLVPLMLFEERQSFNLKLLVWPVLWRHPDTNLHYHHKLSLCCLPAPPLDAWRRAKSG